MGMKRTPPPASWAEDINDWLESLKAAGLSDETVRCRRCKMTKAARDLAKTPLEVTAEDMVHWMAAQKWKPESRKGYRNTLSSFYGGCTPPDGVATIRAKNCRKSNDRTKAEAVPRQVHHRRSAQGHRA